MKPSMAIKPLVFAIAAVMAVAANADDRRGHGHNNNHTPPAKQVDTSATAHANDVQRSTGNTISNEGTINEPK